MYPHLLSGSGLYKNLSFSLPFLRPHPHVQPSFKRRAELFSMQSKVLIILAVRLGWRVGLSCERLHANNSKTFVVAEKTSARLVGCTCVRTLMSLFCLPAALLSPFHKLISLFSPPGEGRILKCLTTC